MKKRRNNKKWYDNKIAWVLIVLGALIIGLGYLSWSNPEIFHPFIADVFSDTFGVGGAIFIGGIFWFVDRRNVS